MISMNFRSYAPTLCQITIKITKVTTCAPGFCELITNLWSLGASKPNPQIHGRNLEVQGENYHKITIKLRKIVRDFSRTSNW